MNAVSHLNIVLTAVAVLLGTVFLEQLSERSRGGLLALVTLAFAAAAEDQDFIFYPVGNQAVRPAGRREEPGSSKMDEKKLAPARMKITIQYRIAAYIGALLPCSRDGVLVIRHRLLYQVVVRL